MLDPVYIDEVKIVHFIAAGTLKPESANGALKTAYEISTRQAERHEVEVWSMTKQAKISNGTKIKGVYNRFLPLPKFRFAPSAATVEVARRELRNVDFVHFHTAWHPTQTLIGALCRHRKIPYSVTPNGAFSANALKKRKLQKRIYHDSAESWFMNKASFLHAVSRNEIWSFKKAGLHAPIVYAPNSVDPGHNQPSCLAPLQGLVERKSKEQIRLVYFGRIDIHTKGLDLLLGAIGQLRRKRPELQFHLHIVGPERPDSREDLLKIASRVGVLDMVSLHEPMYGQDRLRVYKSTDLFILTSRNEGLPFSPIEVMAMEIPVLVTYNTNLGDDVMDYGAGLAVRPTQVDIARGLEHLLSDANLKQMGLNARRMVSARYNWNETVQTLEKAILQYAARFNEGS